MDVKQMTDEQILREQCSDSLLAKVWWALACHAAQMEQANAQRKQPTIMELRRIELTNAAKLLELIEEKRAD